MIPLARFGESVCGFFAEDLCMFMIVGWDNLVPGVNCLVSGLLGELLRYRRLCDTGGVNFQDTEI